MLINTDSRIAIKTLPNLDDYVVPQCGEFGEELAWYCTDDTLVLGIVFRVPILQIKGHRFPPRVYYAWTVLTPKPQWEAVNDDEDADDMFAVAAKDFPAGAYRAVEAEDKEDHQWYQTVGEAIAALHTAMLQIHKMQVQAAIRQARRERLGLDRGAGAPFERIDRFTDKPEPVDDADVQSAARHMAEWVAAGKRRAESLNIAIKRLANLDAYDRPQHFGVELAYFATEDDLVLGVVFRDDEYGGPPDIYVKWVLLTRKPEWEVIDQDTDDPYTLFARDLPAGVYRAELGFEYWHKTFAEAVVKLHEEMVRTHKEMLTVQ